MIFIPRLILMLAVAHLPISIYGHRLVLQYEPFGSIAIHRSGID